MKAKILVVEDEVIIGMDIKNSLKKLGYDVPCIVATGEKAIEKAQQIQPDLILMDIMLKGEIDGVTAAEEIRQQFDLPIVFLTAHTDAKTLQRAKDAQPFGYIVKPFQEKDLYTTIEIALARCKAETEIRKALQKEKELNELKSRFVSMVSHEFRTPMSTILFSSDLLEMYMEQWPVEKKKIHIKRIQVAIQRMIEMLDDILILGKTEAGKLQFNSRQINIKYFCNEIIEDIQISDPHHHRFEINLQIPELQHEFQLDDRLLRHILINLLSNAVKYSPPESLVYLEVFCDNQDIEFKIKDSGIGIPTEDQTQLFEAFYRATNVGTISGTGLGLAIVKRSVELHRGSITVDSEVGVGTTFTVRLPVNADASSFESTE